MKKYIALIIAACLIGVSVFLIATGDKETEDDLSTRIKTKITAYRTDLSDSADTLDTTSAIKNYLCNWAETKGISYSVDDADNVTFEVKASKAYENAPPTVILCGYDPKHFQNCIDPISVALYLAKNNENTGKLTVIFTSEENHNFYGISKLDKDYFPDDANVFNLNGGSKNMWSTTTAGSASYTFSSDINRTEPKGNKAYKISITGLSGGIPNEKIGGYPNPIKELGDLLAYFKTNSVIFELSEIVGGSSGNLYPESASCTIVIDEGYIEKFEKRMNIAIENFNDTYSRYGATYEYEEVTVPQTVISTKDMNKLVSLLYTLVDGVYERDEEDNILSITNIGAIKCKGDTCTIYASGNSLTKKGLNQLDLSYTTICGLSDVDYDKTATQSLWTINKPEEDPFVQEVSAAFKEYSDGTMHYRDSITTTNCSYVYDLNPNCNLMNITVNWKRIEKYAGTLVTFMMKQNQTE